MCIFNFFQREIGRKVARKILLTLNTARNNRFWTNIWRTGIENNFRYCLHRRGNHNYTSSIRYHLVWREQPFQNIDQPIGSFHLLVLDILHSSGSAHSHCSLHQWTFKQFHLFDWHHHQECDVNASNLPLGSDCYYQIRFRPFVEEPCGHWWQLFKAFHQPFFRYVATYYSCMRFRVRVRFRA